MTTFRVTAVPLLSTALTLASCGGDSSGAADARNPNSPDAAPPSCEERMPLTIGHCIEADTGNPCVSAESEMQLFRSIEEQSVVYPIIGLQGSPMFVMAVQAQGIAPGNDLDAPEVEVRIYDGEQDVGGYEARPLVFESETTAGLMTAPRLFVVSFFADQLEGKELDVIGQVEDRNGQTWCSKGSFSVGALIDAPPTPL
ncbi:MAG: hypothetical protein GY811_02580 [Myxococcales bacterium]|nr:hypothetical protein [Myxococcales bacterium]